MNEFRGFKIKQINNSSRLTDVIIHTEPCNDEPDGHVFKCQKSVLAESGCGVGDYYVAIDGNRQSFIKSDKLVVSN